jgi:predicted RNA-binding protein with PUA-like domain
VADHWLLKTEPSTYSFADLERDKKAVWDGVSNALALKHLQSMKRGDLSFIYLTGEGRGALTKVLTGENNTREWRDAQVVSGVGGHGGFL